ncbi:MAG: hypothetical protein ABI721_01990 [Candidatus Dojkabacteria bacterium]
MTKLKFPKITLRGLFLALLGFLTLAGIVLTPLLMVVQYIKL